MEGMFLLLKIPMQKAHQFSDGNIFALRMCLFADFTAFMMAMK
jgi:hypothetical protein